MPHLLLSIIVSLTTLSTVAAQSCYYPNGELTTVDAPCPNSDLCCPLSWQCLANGLCYDPINEYYERRTCTDSTWQSSECPNFCTYSEAGNEAILLCSSGEYCCDGNRVSINCCKGELPPGTDYFKLQGGDDVVGSITAMGSAPTSSRSSSTSDDGTFSTPTSTDTTTTLPGVIASATAADRSSLSSQTARTSSSISMRASSSAHASASGLGGGSSASEDSEDDRASHSPLFGMGAIIGLAIGVSVLLVLSALIAFLLWRRHKKSKILTLATATYTPAPSSPTEIKYTNTFPPGTHAPEIDSSPKATTDGTSELYGSDSYARSSTVSSTTAGAQGYSPTSMVSPVVSTGGNGGAPGRMSQIEEKDEPPAVELWGGPVYRPYRPGMENPGGQGTTHNFGNAQPYSGT